MASSNIVEWSDRGIFKGNGIEYIGNSNRTKQCINCVFRGHKNFLCKCNDCIVYGDGNMLVECENCTVYGKETIIDDDCTDCREVNIDGPNRVQILQNVHSGGTRVQMIKGGAGGQQIMNNVTCGGNVGQYML